MIGRRTFLRWGAAAPVLMGLPVGAGASQPVPQNTIVVIDDIHAGTDAGRLALVLGAFTRRGLAVTCLIHSDSETATRLRPDSALSHVLRTQWQELPGLVELVPLVRDLAAMTPYFQARAVHDAMVRVQQSLWSPGDARGEGALGRTIACDMLREPTAPAGVRACGVRNMLMRPLSTTPVKPEAWDAGVVRMVGGQRVTLDMPPRAFRLVENTAVERVLYLSADTFRAHPLPSVVKAASDFAATLVVRDAVTWTNPILASDMQFRDAFGYDRCLSLHFAQSAGADPRDVGALADFRLELLEAGVPSTFGENIFAQRDTGYWIPLEGQHRADVPNRSLAVYPPQAAANFPQSPGAEYGIETHLTDLQRPGLDPQGAIGVRAHFLRSADDIAALADVTAGSTDCVLIVPDGVVRGRPQRNLLKQAVLAIAEDGISTPTTISDHVRAIAPYGPYITHFRRTQAYLQRPPAASKNSRSLDKEQLMKDAQVAWSYFERWTNAKTGLCPATVNGNSNGEDIHEAVTMWDVGSHINALMAAIDLGLITPNKFRNAIRKILPNIAGRVSQGRRLPQGWIATTKIKWGNKNFDASDAGRLLTALYNLEMHPEAKEKPSPIVATWDLEKIVRDGVAFSVEDGKLKSAYKSHCAHYAAWAFRTWGIEARSPYEVFSGKSEADGQMALLEVCGDIGPLGAEPLLMEAIEVGMSPESAYLAEVLFAAQIEEYEQTGKLTCVSEGPIDRDPWFIYQGLQFDAPGRVWATDTVAGLPEHRSVAFREKNLAISSKGAYLWAAYKDHPYCDVLVDFVRDRAKTQGGFASNIYQNSGKPTAGYADINTNAVILQSIAYMIKNGKSAEVRQNG